jgi:hypothetical protein
MECTNGKLDLICMAVPITSHFTFMMNADSWQLFAVTQVKKLQAILRASKTEKVTEGRIPSMLQPLNTSTNSQFPCALKQWCIQWIAYGDNWLMAAGNLKWPEIQQVCKRIKSVRETMPTDHEKSWKSEIFVLHKTRGISLTLRESISFWRILRHRVIYLFI